MRDLRRLRHSIGQAQDSKRTESADLAAGLLVPLFCTPKVGFSTLTSCPVFEDHYIPLLLTAGASSGTSPLPSRWRGRPSAIKNLQIALWRSLLFASERAAHIYSIPLPGATKNLAHNQPRPGWMSDFVCFIYVFRRNKFLNEPSLPQVNLRQTRPILDLSDVV